MRRARHLRRNVFILKTPCCRVRIVSIWATVGVVLSTGVRVLRLMLIVMFMIMRRILLTALYISSVIKDQFSRACSCSLVAKALV